MTERLYYTDSYVRAFDAAVLERSDDGRRVVLDRTAFYPTSGGQPFDTGALGDSRVVDVVDEGDHIAHLLDRALGADHVRGVIDWPRRHDHMQQHTGQHLLSAVLAELYGLATTSVHFGTESSTIDLASAALSPEQVTEAEERANAIASENRPVTVGFEDAGSAEGLRKASERQGRLRIVTIADLDRSACGGTHVRSTGEIGPILLRKVERVRQIVRLEFLCGLRAVRRARADFQLLGHLAASYSAAAEDLPVLLEQQRAELKQAATARRELERALDAHRARELYDSSETRASGSRLVLVRDEAGMTMERLRGLAQAVVGSPRVVFIGTTREPPAVLLATSEDSGMDAGHRLRQALDGVGGRGGGNARLAQGSVPADAVDTVVQALAAPLDSGR